MKRKIIVTSAFGLLSLLIYSCNNQDSSSNTTTEQTTEVKAEDTASTVGKTDTVTIQTEAPKLVEEAKKKPDTSSAKGKLKPVVKTDLPKSDAIDQSAIDEGKELISKSDCLACHKLQDKSVGPSYSDVAAKYSYSKRTVQDLASKVVSGGAGVWGQIPMTPHPNITSENAQKMVTYILSLKK